MARTYELFISHGWSYEDSYYRLLDYLDSVSNTYEDFEYVNNAYLEPDALDLSYTDELKVEYKDQIEKSEAVILLADLYREPEPDESNLMFWLDQAIEIAEKNNLTILGIRPWDETQTPREIEHVVDYWVDWDPEAIKKALESHI